MTTPPLDLDAVRDEIADSEADGTLPIVSLSDLKALLAAAAERDTLRERCERLETACQAAADHLAFSSKTGAGEWHNYAAENTHAQLTQALTGGGAGG